MSNVPAELIRGIADFTALRWRRSRLRGEALRRYQEEALRQMLGIAVARSQFYRELYAGRDLADFRALPTIDKSTMMREFDRLNTASLARDEVMAFALEAERTRHYLGYFRERYVVGLSSGTSGFRGLYVTDRRITERLPFVFLARSGIALTRLPLRIAFFLRVFNQGFADINGPLISLRYFATMAAVDESVDGINALRANVLMGPPSMLRLLARERTRITAPISVVISYAEVLEREERAKLQRVFGAKVVEVYQASEGLIACPCRYGALHINEDLMFVELVDEAGREVATPGVPCAGMIVTNLYNEVQPLIRYRMNDLLVLGTHCPCGSSFRVIDRVLGRDDDVFYFRRPDGSLGHVFPDVFSRWIITSCDDILEYAVEQPDPDHLVVAFELKRPDLDAAARAKVLTAVNENLALHGLRPADIQWRTYPGAISRGPGKFKRFRRCFDASAQDRY